MPLAQAQGMHQTIATARSGLLFETWEEADRLWRRLSRAFPQAHALCLLPDRLLLIEEKEQTRALARVLLGHTRSLGRPHLTTELRQRALGALRPATLELFAAPCRRGVVADPLAWTWTTYREAVGVIPGRVDEDPEDLHHDTCRAAGVDLTPMPEGLNFPNLEQVRDAVSAATRTPISRMHRPGPHRALWICAARELCQVQDTELMAACGAGPLAMMQATGEAEVIAQVKALVGDPRFPGLASGKGPWVGARRAA